MFGVFFVLEVLEFFFDSIGGFFFMRGIRIVLFSLLDFK